MNERMTEQEAARIVAAVREYEEISKVPTITDFVNERLGTSMTPREFGQKKRHALLMHARAQAYISAQQELTLDAPIPYAPVTTDDDSASAEDLDDGYNYEED